MHIANQPVLLLKYDFLNWDSSEFVNKLPEDARDEFKTFLAECHLLAKTSLQLVLDVTDASSRVVASAIALRRAS